MQSLWTPVYILHLQWFQFGPVKFPVFTGHMWLVAPVATTVDSTSLSCDFVVFSRKNFFPLYAHMFFCLPSAEEKFPQGKAYVCGFLSSKPNID